ncbi:MAG TPA: PilZ domain-containing protein [Tichowtungia sp.]|nr:PilZ domain-containing protein [Tichowtungia sp.]HKL26428.1 PilZ domain-containing protein [Desulfuromonadales bacterium]
MKERMTVLLTDRSESFLMYLSILLQRMDFDVVPAEDGPSLVKLSKALQPAAIILGPDVGGMSAPDILEALEKNGGNAIPVLVAGKDETRRETLMEAGCQGFLHMPIEIDQLHAALSKALAGDNYQRQFLRANYQRKVTLAMDERMVKCQGITLSEGGIFIRRKTPFPEGCRLQIELPLGDQETLFVDGEVIYTKQLSKGRFSMPPGMAVRFINMIDEDRQLLKNHIKKLLAGDLIEEQDEPILNPA